MNDTTKETIRALREAAVAIRREYGDEGACACSVVRDICERALTTKEAKGWKDGVPDALKIKEPEAAPEMMVCEMAKDCDPENCTHEKPHPRNAQCDRECNGSRCIPVAKVETEEKLGDWVVLKRDGSYALWDNAFLSKVRGFYSEPHDKWTEIIPYAPVGK